MINKRKYTRVPMTGTTIVKYENKGYVTIKTTTGSISLGGIALYSDYPIEIDTDVSMTISFITVDGIKSDSVKGRVMHNKKIEGIYSLGIYFSEEINPKNQPSLYEHIKNILTLDK
jgi:c-di-GMP-binding flagellar brake protein YcgR